MDIKQYTDIGHGSPRDIIWILHGLDIDKLMCGATFTHEIIWGKDIENHWRGRFEVSTGFCSIVPPLSKETMLPPQGLLDILKSNFPVFKFYYFANGIEEIWPNPHKRLSVPI